MARFEFKNYTVKLDFGDDLKFEIDADEILEKIQKHTTVFEKMQKSKEKNENTVIKKTIEAIDDILGEGVTNRIFDIKETKITIMRLVEIWTYICEEHQAFSKGLQNRAQRRAKK